MGCSASGQRPVSFLTDYNQGKVRLQFLGNFHPNEDQEQLDYLERVFDYRATGAIPRWQVLREQKRIILYRVPIERLGHPHIDDDLHRRMMIEGAVFRAAAEYLDRDPWDLGPERFRFF